VCAVQDPSPLLPSKIDGRRRGEHMNVPRRPTSTSASAALQSLRITRVRYLTLHRPALLRLRKSFDPPHPYIFLPECTLATNRRKCFWLLSRQNAGNPLIRCPCATTVLSSTCACLGTLIYPSKVPRCSMQIQAPTLKIGFTNWFYTSVSTPLRDRAGKGCRIPWTERLRCKALVLFAIKR
jgi:hypothetical protein